MEKVLTVVIPSFNVEKYLRQTLESLRNEEILEDVEVLIVDDEIMIRRGLSKIIHWEEIGFEMAGAVGNAMEALELIKKTPVDVLLTDISMPEMTGLELIHQARKILPGLKAVVISGYSEFDYAREAIELKVENYILKPLDPKKITETFQKICKELDQEQRRERREQYLQSEYEVRRGADPEKKGCDDEWQTKMIQVLEEGRYKELDGFVDQWFLQMEKMDSRQIREYCYKSLRKAVMYFHMDTPPLFKIYQLSDQDQEKFSKILKDAAVNGIVKSHEFPPVLLSACFLSLLFRSNGENYLFAARSAASTTWLARIVLVTVPTPPGTGVMASTTGSTSAKRVSPQRLPSAPTWMPTSSTT